MDRDKDRGEGRKDGEESRGEQGIKEKDRDRGRRTGIGDNGGGEGKPVHRTGKKGKGIKCQCTGSYTIISV